MIEQLKLLLEAAQWRLSNEYSSVDYASYQAAEQLVGNLKRAISDAQEYAELTKDRPFDYDPLAHASL